VFSKIVVGIAGSTGGEDALALARALAGSDTEIVLVNAFPHDQHASRAGSGGFEEVLRSESLGLLDRAAGPSGADQRAVGDVSPGRALQHVAEETEADLIVVGSCHHGSIARVLLGDVSRAVLHGAPCPVVVAPRGYHEESHRIATIGVGFNRSPEAGAALELAVALARDKDAGLRLRTSVTVPVAFVPAYAYTYDWGAIEAEHRTMAQADLEEATAGVDVPVVTETTSGTPSGDLTELSELVDLMIVGSRGWGAGRRVVLGSTSDRLTHHAQCPVLVVPAGCHDRATPREAVAHA
jgi:nucleotide-binding universal stress UspA family protein